MVELHGWITIRETYESDKEEDNIREITESIASYIENYDFGLDLIKLSFYNGTPCLTIALYKNRYSQEVNDAFTLFNYIAKVAVGSYGMMYLHDDEDTQGKDNLFQVFVLSRGKIIEYEDTFLSPLIPKVEDYPQ